MQKRMSELTPQEQEERRRYNRDSKKRSREREKQEREAVEKLTAHEYCDVFFGSPDYARMREYKKDTVKKITNELGTDLDGQATEVVHYVLSASFGFENRIMRQVTDPIGLMVGGVFPDVIGRQIVAGTHKYNLERSTTFSNIYRHLLRILDLRFGKQLSQDPIEKQAALDVKAELAGTYVLRTVA
jgi:hypothetical protein